MIEVAIGANQVIHHQPNNWKKYDPDIKTGANYKGFLYDMLSCKIKTNPGKNGCYAIA